MNIEKIQEHYDHAREKHPYFADRLFVDDNDAKWAKMDLASVRMILNIELEQGKVYAETLAKCEVAEVCDAIARGDKAATRRRLSRSATTQSPSFCVSSTFWRDASSSADQRKEVIYVTRTETRNACRDRGRVAEWRIRSSCRSHTFGMGA